MDVGAYIYLTPSSALVCQYAILKLVLFPQLIAALKLITMHVHCLYWLMSTDLLLQSLIQRPFFRPCKSTTGEMASMEDSNLAVGT